MTPQADLLHSAGHRQHQNNYAQFLVERGDAAYYRSKMLSAILELWCKNNCQGRWRVDYVHDRIMISFSTKPDFAMFRLSREFMYFDPEQTTMRVAENYG